MNNPINNCHHCGSEAKIFFDGFWFIHCSNWSCRKQFNFNEYGGDTQEETIDFWNRINPPRGGE